MGSVSTGIVLNIVVAGILLAGCTDSDWQQSMRTVGLSDAPPARADSRSPDAGRAGADSLAADDAILRQARVIRVSSQSAAVIRGSDVSGQDGTFCEAVASGDAAYGSYDPATSQRVHSMRLAQCIALMAR